MKVVINKCWGGFGLSHKAIMRYAELAGLKLYPFIDTRDKDGRINFHKFTPYTGQKDVFCIHYSTKPLNSEGKYEDETYWSYRDIERDNPLLIQVIEEMGEEANGDHANLVIREIPDDVKYEINEYDGQESIHEVVPAAGNAIRWADAQQKEKEKMDEFEKWLESLPDTHFRGMDEMEIAKEAFYAGKKAAQHSAHPTGAGCGSK